MNLPPLAVVGAVLAAHLSSQVSWRNSGTASPLSRQMHAMAVDPQQGMMMLFGGYDRFGNDLDDTGAWHGSNWLRRTPATPPPASPVDPPANGRGIATGHGLTGNFGAR